MDPRQLVADAYDRIADDYLRRFGNSQTKERWAGELILRTTPGARILDLGCGAGVPLARRLAAEGFAVTGVDGSARQIELARVNVPGAEFVQSDMTTVRFADEAFAAVAAFYSLNHVPRALYAALFRAIHDWLQPGGVFVGNLGATDEAGWTGEWLGAQTFFSGHDPQVVLDLFGVAGFELESYEMDADRQDDGDFLWIIARRPAI